MSFYYGYHPSKSVVVKTLFPEDDTNDFVFMQIVLRNMLLSYQPIRFLRKYLPLKYNFFLICCIQREDIFW